MRIFSSLHELFFQNNDKSLIINIYSIRYDGSTKESVINSFVSEKVQDQRQTSYFCFSHIYKRRMFMFKWFKPAPHIDRLDDAKTDETYKRLRLQVFWESLSDMRATICCAKISHLPSLIYRKRGSQKVN